MVDGYSGFLFLDEDGMPLVAMHWEHRLNHMVKRYNEIFREQMPNITPHVRRHTYCSIQARAGMYPKTPAGAIRPAFDCSGFLSMVYYLETGTAPGVFRAVNRSAFYYFSAASDGPDLTMKSDK